MNTKKWVAGFLCRLVSNLLVIGCLFPIVAACAATPENTRIALTPFSAPAGNQKLQTAATVLPDLLTASLSRDGHFQLVEREKINAVWSELHLTEAGMTSADTVAKMGKILSCDWLLSGSLIPTTNGPQIWIKIIDTQSSVVLDLKSLPYNATSFSATATNIAGFLAQARTRTGPHEYIALGKFEDRTVSSTREDWTPRLIALIEKHFLDAGYGVVERESVAPIFSEYQLQSAHLTADARRVKLKPAFWVVSGSWKWIYDTQDKLSVTIDIQKMGGAEQMLSFAKAPGAGLENAVVDALQTSLKSTGSVTAEQALASEQKLRSAHVDELTKGRGETFAPSRFPTETPPVYITHTNPNGEVARVKVDPDFTAQNQKHVDEMMKSLQQAVLLNPSDSGAKFKLGMALYDGTDSAQSRQGEKLLEEVTKSRDPVLGRRAQNWLIDVRNGKISFKRDSSGQLEVITKDNPASLPNRTPLSAEAQAKRAAQFAILNEIPDVIERSGQLIQIPNPSSIADLNGGVTGYGVGSVYKHSSLIVACGSSLYSFYWGGMFGFGSGTVFEKINVPVKIQNTVTVIENTDADLWLGTDGCLIRIPKAGGPRVIFGEKDGFPMSSITALRTAPGRLLIGFGRGRKGAFGYLDLATQKFAVMEPGLMGNNSPPDSPVSQIKTDINRNTYWVTAEKGIYRLNLDSQQWTKVVPSPEIRSFYGIPGLRTLARDDKFIAAVDGQTGIDISPEPGNQWAHVNLSTNVFENEATTLCFDGFVQGHLWVGVPEKIMLLDLNLHKVIAECKLPNGCRPTAFFIYPEDIFFLTTGIGGSELYHGSKPGY